MCATPQPCAEVHAWRPECVLASRLDEYRAIYGIDSTCAGRLRGVVLASQKGRPALLLLLALGAQTVHPARS